MPSLILLAGSPRTYPSRPLRGAATTSKEGDRTRSAHRSKQLAASAAFVAAVCRFGQGGTGLARGRCRPATGVPAPGIVKWRGAQSDPGPEREGPPAARCLYAAHNCGTTPASIRAVFKLLGICGLANKQHLISLLTQKECT
jgi:hypothetical protein